MSLKSEKDIIAIIEKDEWMMEILTIAKQLELPDWWISAGFVRSKIWDTLHRFNERTPLADIDVIYFHPTNLNESEEKRFEEKLKNLAPNIPWSVKNQARMHVINHLDPYQSSIEGISNFTETATALGVKLDEANQVILTAPWGIDDAINLVVRPTPKFRLKENYDVYLKRIEKKNWKSIWYKLQLE